MTDEKRTRIPKKTIGNIEGKTEIYVEGAGIGEIA